jgi:hypothetical protein
MKQVDESSEQAGGPADGSGDRRNTIANLISTIETNIKEVKYTVGDYIRLLQYEKEMAAEETPKEMHVSWINPEETSVFDR